ncbi:MAG: PAS domain S-box protein [Schleiferiaceae bacterium]|nr:PAS domain S-box protein [Schleiferiaceae bacterium]
MNKEGKLSTNQKINLIAIGASAGGLEALQEFLFNLIDLPNTAIIIAQHLSPTHKSLLVQLLSKQTSLKVFEATTETFLAPNSVYITPPDKEVTVRNNCIYLGKPSSSIGPKPSVDVLFQSLSNITTQNVVAIVLSGTGSDGAKGVSVLKNNNFFKIAQDPKSAKYDGMPNAAIQTGHIDAVLSPKNMSQEILKFFLRPKFHEKQENKDTFEDTFLQILDILGKNTGADFSNYKPPTLLRRLEKRMQNLGITTIDTYLRLLKTTPTEALELYQMMLIGVTQFFRDKESFDALGRYLKNLIKSKKDNETIRIWVPACSTGEEAYSLAMLLCTFMGSNPKKLKVQIFATDIDERAIEAARKAQYPASHLEFLPREFTENFFIKKGKTFEVIKSIRSLILFSKHDVIQNPPFLRLDLVSCRNLLIYFNAALQQQLLPLFHYALDNDGLLFLGKSETIGHFTDLFTTIDAKHKIFKRNKGGAIHAVKFSNFRAQLISTNKMPRETPKHKATLPERIKETLFNTYEHPYVIINRDADIVEVFGDVRLFMSLVSGSIQVNLIKMVNHELQIELRGLLTKLFKAHEIQRSPIKKFNLYGSEYYVRITAKPLIYKEESSDLFMVIFEQLDIDSFIQKGSKSDHTLSQSTHIEALELELSTTKEHLQTYIEEIETTNEELQSLNEELQSTNEELQSSTEELETTNEELQSTNEEIQITYAELKSVYDTLYEKDLVLQETEANSKALLNNNLQAFILIDDTYKILQYNNKAIGLLKTLCGKEPQIQTSLIDYLPSNDIELFLNHFKEAFTNSKKEMTFEHQVRNNTSKTLWLRIAITPIIGKSKGNPSRITIGLLDITKVKNTEIEILNSKKRLENLLNSQTHYVLQIDLEGNHIYWNHIFERDYGWLYQNIAGSSVLQSICDHDLEKAKKALEICLNNPDVPYTIELDKPSKSGGLRTTLWDWTCVTDENGNPYEIQCTGVEISQTKQLRESERLLNEAQRLSKIGNWNYLVKQDVLTWSDGLYEVFDVDRATFKETHGSFLSLIDIEDRERAKATSQHSQQTGQSFHLRYKITTNKGEKRIIEEYGFAEKDENGEIIRLYGTAQNITDRIETEEKLINSDRIFNYASDMLCIAGFDGFFKVLNPAWSKVLGWTIDELLAKPYLSFVHPDDRDKTKREGETVGLKEGSVFFENRYLCKDGSYKWLSWNSFPYPEESKLYAVARDITKDKQLQSQLKESENRFKQIVENAPSVIWETDINGKFTYVSSKSIKIWGYKPEDIIGEKYFYDLTPTSERASLRAAIEKITTNNKNIVDFQNTIIKSDGNLIEVVTNASPFFDERGNRIGYRGSDIEITEKLLAEKTIREKQELLSKITNQVPGMVYQYKQFTDGSSCFPYASNNIESIYWTTPEAVKEDASSIFSLFHVEDIDFVKQEVSYSIDKLTPLQIEFRVLNPHTKEIEWRQVDAKPERHKDGSTLWHGIIRNSTEKKQQELELQKLTEAVRQSPNTIVITDPEGEIIYANPQFTEITGYTYEEIKGKNPKILKSGIQDASFYSQLWNTISAGNTWKGELYNKKKDGSFYWESAIISPIKDAKGKIINYLAIKEDISKDKFYRTEIERFKAVSDNAVYGMALADLSGNFTYINPFYAKIHGYSSAELIGKSLTTFHSKDQLDYVEKLLIEIKENGSFKPTVVWHTHKDGSSFPMFMSGLILYNELGQPTQMAATAIDMSEFYRAENELKKSENRLKKLIDYSTDIIVLMKEDGSNMLVSPSAKNITGYSPEELMAMPRHERIHPEDVAMIDKAFASLLTNPEAAIKTTYRHKHKTKGYVWFESNAQNFLGDPSFNAILLIIRDITQDKIIQDRIKESEAKYRIVADNTYNWEFWEGAAGELLYISPSVEKITGYPAVNFLNDNDFLKEIILAEDWKQYQDHRDRCLCDKKGDTCRFRILHKNGEIRYIEHVCQPALDENGEFMGIRGSNIDVTETSNYLYRIESLLQLEEEQNKRLKNFTHIVSHNLRTHTANMQGVFTLMNMEKPTILQDEYVSMVKQSADNLNQTLRHLNEVLDITKNLESKFEDTSIRKSIDMAINTVNQLAKDQKVTIIDNTKDCEIENIKAIPAYLDSIVLNFITNSIKFKDPSKEAFVKISCEIDEQNIYLVFEDNGLGIDLNKHGHKLFGMYKTFHNHKESTGLGLFITKNQIEAMSGSIQVESVPGEGSTFTVSLPKFRFKKNADQHY